MTRALSGIVHQGRVVNENTVKLTNKTFQVEVSIGYNQIAYRYRDMLDEMGCRFPKNFNPPVHWYELFSVGWDTRFGSFLLGEEWLGECKEYLSMIGKDYGLKTFLHTPMPIWASNCGGNIFDGPHPVKRLIKVKDTITGIYRILPAKTGPQICLGSKQFMDEAEKRLIKPGKAGVIYFMYDGTCWKISIRKEMKPWDTELATIIKTIYN